MAKNIFEKKKRVTHVKGLRSSIDCGDMLPGDLDYVSSIIKNMDTNYEEMRSSNFKINHSTKVTSKTVQDKDEKDKSISSTSKNPTQLCKFKKFGLNRKFPLMEKSQKVLKQLKHNQSIPKQRAHLSIVPGLPVKNNPFKNALPVEGKTMHSMVNIKRNLSYKKNHNKGYEIPQKIKSFPKGTEKSTLKKMESSQNTVLKSDCNSKNTVPSSTKRPKASSKHLNKDSNTSSVRSENSNCSSKKSKLGCDDDFHTYYKRSYFRNNSIAMNITDDQSDSNSHNRGNSGIHKRNNSSISSRSSSNISSRSNSNISSRSNSIVNKKSSNVLNDRNYSSMGDTTDSEIEKFVERNKKDLQKKSKISKKKKTVKRSSKKIVRKLSDSESNGEEVSPSKNKKMKVAYEKLKSKVYMANESEHDLMDGDMCTRDSSSESDESLVNTTCSSPSVQSKGNESYVSLPETKSEKDKAESKVLMYDEAGVVERDLSSERHTTHLDTNCSSLYVQSKDKDSYVLPEPDVMTDEDNIVDYHNNQTLSSNYEKGYEKQMASPNSLLDSDNYVEKDSLISCESSKFINEGSNIEKKENEIPEYIELSSSEDDECLSSDLCLNSVVEGSGKSFINISVFSEAATLNSTATDSEKSNLNAVEESEESDIEIVDVIVIKPKKAESSKAMDNNSLAASYEENSINHKAQIIKSEPQMPGIQIKKENEYPKNNVVTNSNHEAVFSTDICKSFDSNGSPKLLQLDSDVIADKIKYTSSGGNSCDQFTSSRIKKENIDDIIIDSAETLKLGDQKLLKKDTNISSNQDQITIKQELPDILVDYVSEHKKGVGLPEVKSENSLVQKIDFQPYLEDKQKFKNDDLKKDIKSEVSSSNILPTKSLHNAALDDLIPSLQINKLDTSKNNVALSQLIELFKQEFQTYQALIEVETNLETKLKQIETKQAEKLMGIRSVIQRLVGTGQFDGGDNSSKTDEATVNMCSSEDLKKLDTKEYIHNLVSSSSKLNSEKREEILSQKEQNISNKLSLKSSPSSLAAENTDMKKVSSFSGSQFIKLEPLSVEDSAKKSDIAMKLLGEKCVICCKNAVAACQKCAKVFFCSNECGRKSWNDGHKDECGKL